jgi:phosphotransferase system  glucose/maltose/N-acetylglucosamine-specific IIC component
MDSHILVALVGGVLNMALSVIVPCLVKKSEQPFLKDVKKVFETNRQVIITSSLIVALTIYLALKISPELGISMEEMGLNLDSSSGSEFKRVPLIVSREMPPQLANLIKLMQN